jgi:hypothetical protein
MLFLIGTALVYSQNTVFLTCLSLIVQPYDHSSKDSGILGFVQQIAGAPGCVIASIVLFRHRQAFKHMSLFVIFGSFVSLLAFHLAVVHMSSKYAFFFESVALIVNGLISAAMGNYAFEYAVELAPNIAEAMSSGLLMVLVNSAALLEICLISYCYEHFNKELVVKWIMLAQYVSMIIGFMLISKINVKKRAVSTL